MMNKGKILLIKFLVLGNVVCNEICSPKIAIIGGGIGGASTAYFLTDLFGNSLSIDLYEANEIGGRLSTVKIGDDEYEGGGAIIHDKNQLMINFAKILGLEKRGSSESERTGIWNGDEFVFEESSYQIITLAKLMYRYGFQPFKLNGYVDSILADFAKIYEVYHNGVGFKNVSALLAAMKYEFPQLLQVSTKDHLTKLGYSSTLIDEIVKTALIVNYGQEVDVQSFVGLVSTAGAGTSLWAVKGGNKKIPENLINQNKNIHVIPSRVTEISYSSNNDKFVQYSLHYDEKMGPANKTYDVVIIATPLTTDHNMPIKFTNFPKDVKFDFPGQYQTTYVTFVKGNLNPSYFGLDSPIQAIFSCNPEKTIISSIGKLTNVQGDDSNVWKIFTRTHLERELINKMFDRVDEIQEIEWQAYPKYNATTMHINKFELHNGLYHVNAIEWAASAMEMSAIGGNNVAILTYNYYKQRCVIKKSRQPIKSEL